MKSLFRRMIGWLRDPANRGIVRGLTVVPALLVVLFVAIVCWYSFRIWIELGPRPWENPTTILGSDGSTILEIYGDHWRPAQPVTLDGLPEHVPSAFLAAEDTRFRSHIGVDPFGIARAAVTNVREGGVAQGGSTITQQLAKTRFLSPERTFRRKIVEAIVAVLIEIQLSKDEILSAYLNDVYLGHHDGSEIKGIDEAARVYFDIEPEKLTIGQAALLAAMVRAPNQENLELLKKRRDAIVDEMAEQGWTPPEEQERAKGEEITFRSGSLPQASDRYFLRALRSELVEEIGSRRLRGGGLKIQTSLDPVMQRAAVDAVVDGVGRLRSRYSWLRRDENPLQGALLSVDPRTGGVRALVGGTSYARSQFDRTRLMRRQPGSAVKPFVYATAIERGELTAASIVPDVRVEVQLSPYDTWTPRNYDEKFRGNVTVREALEKSLNVPVVRVADETGVHPVQDMFERARLGRSFSDTAVIALGVDEVTMWDLVGAYTVFPNLGVRMEPHLVERVETASGRVIHEADDLDWDVLDPPVAYVLHSMLRGVVERGTASALRGSGVGAVAGKTGTTSDYRDAWFVGYSPDLVTAAWVGFDDGNPLRISSAEAALPVWSRFMRSVPHEKGDVSAPEGVTTVTVERSTGLVWRRGCGSSIEETFVTGTEPTHRCQPRPRRRAPAPREPERFLEPSVISLDKLREWLDQAPGVDHGEDEERRDEEPPSGLEPGAVPESGPVEMPPIEPVLPESQEGEESPPRDTPPIAPAPGRLDPEEVLEERAERREEAKERREEEKEERREQREEKRERKEKDPPGKENRGSTE